MAGPPKRRGDGKTFLPFPPLEGPGQQTYRSYAPYVPQTAKTTRFQNFHNLCFYYQAYNLGLLLLFSVLVLCCGSCVLYILKTFFNDFVCFISGIIYAAILNERACVGL